jgi:uncharacterized protein YdaU (DUF1376 family)
MSQTDIWMPLFIGDYIAATTALDAEESGCYLHLLMQSWIAGPLPNDENKLMRIARLYGSSKQGILHGILESFFILTEAGWINKRLEEEKVKANRRRDSAIENGRKGGRPRNPEETDGLTDGLTARFHSGYPNHNPTPNPEKSSSPSPSPSPSPSEEPSKQKEEEAHRKRFVPPTIEMVAEYGKEYSGIKFTEASRFVDFYTSKGWLVGKNPMKDWQAAVRGWMGRNSPVIKPEDEKAIREAEKRREAEARSIRAEKTEDVPFDIMDIIRNAKEAV